MITQLQPVRPPPLRANPAVLPPLLLVRGASASALTIPKPTAAPPTGPAMQAFEAADINKDGKLDKAEFANFLSRVGGGEQRARIQPSCTSGNGLARTASIDE